MQSTKITAETIRSMKSGGEKIVALSAYDFPMARLLDEAGIPLLLVGDSLGTVVLGYSDTTHVTMEEMEHHVRTVARAKPRALVAADLPFGSYATVKSALVNAKRLIGAGAKAVKAEGGRAILDQVRAIVAAGIPFVGHLGMLPKHVIEEGDYYIKGKKELLADADALVRVGAFAIVLELVTAPVALELTGRVQVPTIGIGSGPDCDGQILVTPDLPGMLPWCPLKHVKAMLNADEQMRLAVERWKQGVKARGGARTQNEEEIKVPIRLPVRVPECLPVSIQVRRKVIPRTGCRLLSVS